MVHLLAAALLITPPRLQVGDPAPPLAFTAVKGAPVQKFSRSKVTVVEFWATWCEPCIKLMPKLSEFWQEYQDRVDLVSVSVMENDQAGVKPFVESMGSKMAFPVAMDKVDKDGKGVMHQRWLVAADQLSIPTAFIVDKNSKIAWIGYPTEMKAVLVKVLDGTWDAAAYRKRMDDEAKDADSTSRLLNDAFGRIAGTPRRQDYAETARWIEANRKSYDGPYTQAGLDELLTLLKTFARNDWETALKLTETEPKSGLAWTYFRPMYVVSRIDALQRLGRDWRPTAEAVIVPDGNPNFHMALVDAMTLPESKLAVKDSKMALRAAEQLAGMARVPMFLIRLAWAQFADGKRDEALKTIDEALKAIPAEMERDPNRAKEQTKSLEEAKAYFEKH